jgi:hypothetical protein
MPGRMNYLAPAPTPQEDAVTSKPSDTTTPSDHALPPEAVLLAPAPPSAVPLRPPAGAWGLVVVAVRTTDAAGASVRYVGDAPRPDPAHTDTADLLAGVWLPAPPPADLHAGDIVVRLHPPSDDPDHDTEAPVVADVEVLAAMDGEWRTVSLLLWQDTRWPHEVAMTVLVHMRYLADAALQDAQWATLTGPIAAAMPDWLSSGLGLAGESAGSPPSGSTPSNAAERGSSPAASGATGCPTATANRATIGDNPRTSNAPNHQSRGDPGKANVSHVRPTRPTRTSTTLPRLRRCNRPAACRPLRRGEVSGHRPATEWLRRARLRH